jgi:hypothetical protein
MPLPEELHAAAAVRLAAAAARLKEAEAEVKAAALAAKGVGLPVSRAAAVAEVHRATIHRWIREAEAEQKEKQEPDDK